MSMTLNKAIDLLSQVGTVEEWNEVRDSIKAKVTDKDWVRNYVPTIDGSGLIVEVLGRDGK